MPQKNCIVLLEIKDGKSSCALVCDLRGQNGGQIQNLHQILHEISLRET